MPKIVDREEKKVRILDAAVRIFAKQGLNNTTIADIAERAGIGKGTVYEYFDSKDQIFTESFQFFMSRIETALEERLTPIQDPLEKLLTYIRGWADVLKGESLDYLEILLDFWAESVRRNQDIPGFNLAEMYAFYRENLKGLLDACVEAKKIKPVNTGITASLILGALDGLMIQWIVDRSVFDMNEALEQTIMILIEGIIVNR